MMMWITAVVRARAGTRIAVTQETGAATARVEAQVIHLSIGSSGTTLSCNTLMTIHTERPGSTSLHPEIFKKTRNCH